MRPNQDPKSVMFLGIENSLITSIYFLQGQMLLRIISKPANLTIFSNKQTFFRVEHNSISATDI